MPEYDFFGTLREELAQLRRELDAAGVRETVLSLSQRFNTRQDEMLAALWRSSKRHGETLAVFGRELAAQTEREAARQSGPDAGEHGGTGALTGAPTGEST